MLHVTKVVVGTPDTLHGYRAVASTAGISNTVLSDAIKWRGNLNFRCPMIESVGAESARPG